MFLDGGYSKGPIRGGGGFEGVGQFEDLRYRRIRKLLFLEKVFNFNCNSYGCLVGFCPSQVIQESNLPHRCGTPFLLPKTFLYQQAARILLLGNAHG